MPMATSAGVATLRSRKSRPPATRTDSSAGAAEVCRSISWKLHLFILENNLTEFVSFILTQCGINVKRKMVLLLDLLFYHYFVLIKYENYYSQPNIAR